MEKYNNSISEGLNHQQQQSGAELSMASMAYFHNIDQMYRYIREQESEEAT